MLVNEKLVADVTCSLLPGKMPLSYRLSAMPREGEGSQKQWGFRQQRVKIQYEITELPADVKSLIKY